MAIDSFGRAWPRGVGPFLVMITLVVACGGTTAPPGSTGPGSSNPRSSPDAPASPGAGGDLGDLAWIFEAPTDPIDVVVTLDAGKKVEAAIPVEGGTVSATGADGTVYRLDIPKDALPTETTIGLTPVTKLTGMPFGREPNYAVQLSPDGLFLYNVAVLTITPAQAIPVDQQLVFGYREDGKKLTMALPVVDSSEIKIQVDHFSGNGVTQGTLADIEPLRGDLGGDVAERIRTAVSTALAESRRAQLAGQPSELPDFEAAFDEFEEQVVNPRVAAAGESCAAGRLAIETVFYLERLRQLMGHSQGGAPFDNYQDLVSNSARQCILEEFELCVEDHVIHRMAFVWRSYERQNALAPYVGMPLVDDAVLREARELTIKCLTFNLKFESTGTATVADYGYDSTVTSNITLRFNPDEDKISGEATLVNESFEFRSPCGGTSTPGDGTFKVGNLKILTAGAQALDQEVGFLMSYLPGATTERATIKICGSTGSLPIPNFGGWTDAFLVTHQAELEREEFGGGFIAIDWEVFGDEYFAKKEWIKESGDFVEVGTFKLYHTPGA